MRIPPGTSSTRGTYLKWLRRIAAAVAVLLVLALGAAVLNNNVSIRRTSRAQFVGNLDRPLARCTDWVLGQYRQTARGSVSTPAGRSLLSNSATAHMVVDCASLSSEPGMKALGSSFVDAWKVDANILGKMVDPAMPTNVASDQELQSLDEDQRWILHRAARNDVALSPQERDDMFSPDNYRTGKATHQLFALCFYRTSKGSTPQLDRLMQKIEERIACVAAIDCRVTDLYLQRLSFLLDAGRPDLVRHRWGERALAGQQL